MKETINKLLDQRTKLIDEMLDRGPSQYLDDNIELIDDLIKKLLDHKKGSIIKKV